MAQSRLKRRAPGKPVILEENHNPWEVGWLIPIATVKERDPIHVRVQVTEHGWRGWEVGGDVSRHSTHWYRSLWSWATDDQVRAYDDEYGKDTFALRRSLEIRSQVETEVCDVTHPDTGDEP